jgi:DUF971 family protein
MLESAPTPRRFLEDDEALVVDWSDGHQSRLTWERLRTHCPCAQCREVGAATARANRIWPGSAAYRPDRMERVGRYAVSFRWGDGHESGIYSWSVLRDLCDCLQCRLDRGED